MFGCSGITGSYRELEARLQDGIGKEEVRVENIGLAALGFVLLNVLFFSFFETSPSFKAAGTSFILLTGIAGMLLTGMVYVGIYAMGFNRFLKFSAVVVMALNLLSLVLIRTQKLDLKRFSAELADFLTHLNKPLTVVLALRLYAGLLALAYVVKKGRDSY